ncbi:unnamed protein product [Symbiodinium natans]|uniref:EF-hand domain-containing protein n=1 Tax=Symbiodinium natans TaxID=878477 RepID=A0A812TRG5_9DINO|nr:unnamed protein product [Symbiodinium natans]
MASAADVALAKVVQLFSAHVPGDGDTTEAFLKKVLKVCCQMPDADLDRLLQAVDTQQTGKVMLSQFINWMFRTFEDKIEEWTTDDELEGFSSALPPGTEKLTLSFVCPDKFTDKALGYIGAGLPATLQKLALALEFSWTECKITSDGFARLATGLPKGLTSLDLIIRNDELPDKALQSLAATLPPALTRAMLSFKDNTEFTDQGMCELLASLPATLLELIINVDANPRLSDRMLEAFADWLGKSGSGLQKLYLISNSSKYTHNGLKQLCAALPSMKELRLEFQSSEADPDLGSQFVVSPDNSITFMGSGSSA